MVVPRSSGSSNKERQKDLLCRVKYCNKLPDIPFDPKFLTYPFDPHRFVKVKFEYYLKSSVLSQKIFGYWQK